MKGEYIDFTTLLPKAMFGAPESQSQTLTLQLNQSGDSYSVQPAASTKKITSFSAWMEAWNIYLAVRVDIQPSFAPHLIAYQRIITSANSRHPLHAWVSYDIKFRTKAANDPSLRWDIRDLDLWLECFPGGMGQSARWPCTYCGSTTHFPDNCSFRPTHANARGGQLASYGPQQRLPPTNSATCREFNHSICFHRNCKFAHRCSTCGGPHSARTCPTQGQAHAH